MLKENNDKVCTFDDLIDVAIQALKDGVLCGVLIDTQSPGDKHIRYRNALCTIETSVHIGDSDDHIICNAIDGIKALYDAEKDDTEMFTIDFEYHMQFINKDAQIKLLNGSVLTNVGDIYLHNDYVMIDAQDQDGNQHTALSIAILKGATVTQQRQEK